MATKATNTINLFSNDGVKVVITREAAAESQFLKDMMEDLPLDETTIPIPLSEIDGETLKKLAEWSEHRIQHLAEREEEKKAKEADRLEKEQRREEEKKVRAELWAAAMEAAAMEPGEEIEAYQETYESEQDEPNPRRPESTLTDPEVAWMPDWDENYLQNIGPPGLFMLITAANFLATETLLDYCAKLIARKLTGMSTKEMRDYLGIENDFTYWEEKALRREHGWAEIYDG